MFYLLLAAFLWGTSFIAGKIAYQMADPALVVLFRLIIASSVMLPVFLRYQSEIKAISPNQWKRLILLGFLTYPVTFLLQFLGLQMTSAASAATMIGVEPIMVVLVGYLFFKEKASLLVILLGVTAFVGVALVVGVSSDENISLMGCFLVLSSTVVVAFWLRMSKQILASMDAKLYTALTIVSGTLFGIPIILFLIKNWDINYSTNGVLAILYLGIGCSLFAGWFWNKGLETTPANLSGIFLALEPVFGVLLAVILLGEMLSLTSIIGILLVVLSAGICIMLPRKSAEGT